MRKPYPLIPLLLTTSLTLPVWAQQTAHVHGIAELNLAIDGDELEIEFVSPADSIVGFEYAPSTDAERKAVADAIAKLRNPENLFDIPASAGCKLHEVEVERHAEGDHDDHDDHKDEHDHDDHDDHKDEHDHDDHDDHKDKHEHDDHDDHKDEHNHDDHGHDEAKTHSEFHAHYHFDCANPGIETIGLRLFETWPEIETVRVQALTPAGQTGGNIEAKDPIIRLQ